MFLLLFLIIAPDFSGQRPGDFKSNLKKNGKICYNTGTKVKIHSLTSSSRS